MRLQALGLVVSALFVVPSVGHAVDHCRARLNKKDGTIQIWARGVEAGLRWGSAPGLESNALLDEASCVAVGRARKCVLAEGSGPRKAPPNAHCRVYLSDGGSRSCEASIGGCTNLDDMRRAAMESRTSIDKLVRATAANCRCAPKVTTTASARSAAAGVHVGSASGMPNTQVSIPVSLSTGGALVAGMQNDLAFDSMNTPIARLPNGRPDCSVNPAINKDGTAFSFQPPGCSGTDCTRIRALVLSISDVDPIPDGSVLYTCRVNIASHAPAGSYPLTLSGVILASPVGQRVCGPGAADTPCATTDGAVNVGPGGATPTPTPTFPPGVLASCGNAVIDAGEECDDGGTCIGGSNAGAFCTAESQCFGNGVCELGPMVGAACANDADCPGSRCVRCRPFGGDGCASNCTLEVDVLYNLQPGNGHGGGSKAVLFGELIPRLELPLTGSLMLTIGKERSGLIPFVVKAPTIQLPQVPVGTIACACVRGVAVKTCGGTLFEADGMTLSTNCSDGFTLGSVVCPASKPCTYVHGHGNSTSAVVGCFGLDGIDVTFTQDCNGTPGGQPFNPIVGYSGRGAAGSAFGLNSVAIGTQIGSCTPTFCTDADPIISRGFPQTQPLTTGLASSVVFDANDFPGFDIGASVTGVAFSCPALQAGTAAETILVTAFPACNQPTLADIVTTVELVAAGSRPVLPTITPTPTPTPMRPGGPLDCSNAVASPSTLWPPHHQLVGIAIGGLTTSGTGPVLVTIVGIRQDEPVNATGDGNTCPDGIGVGSSMGWLRAERSGQGDGRVYHVDFVAEDALGATCAGTVKVCVPHDQSGRPCGDQGPLFDSAVCP